MRWSPISLLVGIIAAIWFSAISLMRTPAADLPSHRNITLLIAHPDDEAMFFAPSLLAITEPSLHNSVSVLCLSNGNADGLGSIRTHELSVSCQQLGVRDPRAVTVVDRPDLPDSMSTRWPAAAIAELLREKAGDAEVVVTFDKGGVSGHPNHVSLLEGAREWIRDQRARGAEGRDMKLYTLSTVGLLRKYASVLDAPWTARGADGLVFVNSWAQFRTAQKAMTTAHKSQMRWFRWGWIGLSRYMVVNDLVEDGAA